MKPKEFEVNTINDFSDLLIKNKFSVSQAIVNSILNNLKTHKKNVHVLSVRCIEENTIFDITLEREHFVDTLKENLKHFEENEMYEQCAKIHNGINLLIGVVVPKRGRPKKA